MNKLVAKRTLTTNGASVMVTIPKVYIQALGWNPSETKLEVVLERGWLRVRQSNDNIKSEKGEFQLYKFAA